jgi:hypothetical protein
LLSELGSPAVSVWLFPLSLMIWGGVAAGFVRCPGPLIETFLWGLVRKVAPAGRPSAPGGNCRHERRGGRMEAPGLGRSRALGGARWRQGKDHHATVVSAVGERLFELAVRNDEAAIERLSSLDRVRL